MQVCISKEIPKPVTFLHKYFDLFKVMKQDSYSYRTTFEMVGHFYPVMFTCVDIHVDVLFVL